MATRRHSTTALGKWIPSLQAPGIKFRSAGIPVLYLSNPNGISKSMRRDMLDGIAEINKHKKLQSGDLEIDACIAQYEMAYRMQPVYLSWWTLKRARSCARYVWSGRPQKRHLCPQLFDCLPAR